MSDHTVSNVRMRGTGKIEKVISYKTEKSDHQEIRLNAEFEGTPTPEQIKKISEVVEEAAKKVGKIVEEHLFSSTQNTI